MIQSSQGNALTWSAQGGSISSLDIAYSNPDPALYFFGLKIGEKDGNEGNKDSGRAFVELRNVGVRSSQQMSVSVQPRAKMSAFECRFHESAGSGLSVLEEASVELQRCILDSSVGGVSLNGGKAVLKECVIFNNKFNGVGAANENSHLGNLD